MRYRELWRVEQIFRKTKAVLETRPVYHHSDAAIRGHLFCSFLALVLRAEFETHLEAAGLDLEWQDSMGDLDCLVETTIEQDGRQFILRNEAPGCAASIFQAARLALPPLFRRIEPAETDPPQATTRKSAKTDKTRKA
jgi:hypothetical protein